MAEKLPLKVPTGASPKETLLIRLEQLKFQKKGQGLHFELADAQLVIRELFKDDLSI